VGILFTETEIASFRNSTEGGKEYFYILYLLKSMRAVNIRGSEFEVPCYGLKEVMQKIIDGAAVSTHEDSILTISPNKNKILDMINFLKDNGVSPYHLVEVIGDKVDECAFEFEEEVENSAYYEQGLKNY